MEVVEENEFPARNLTFIPYVFCPPSTGSDSDAESSSSDTEETFMLKKRKLDSLLPPGFLDPLPPEQRGQLMKRKKMKTAPKSPNFSIAQSSCKQFWKAGDYEGDKLAGDSSIPSPGGGMDHLRVHPRFLHSNATSHKWALGAFAELLDNSLDEVCNGATFVNVDVILNNKDNSKMLLVEDDGGGMNPDKLRQCMSLGYSPKSKLPTTTIGQYGNGFKTSTMRLGADVIVFSKSWGYDGLTQSIGMLSYTFLRKTGKEDIVVPMIDYELRGLGWKKMVRSSSSDWTQNLETILHWSPYRSEEELLQQFWTFDGCGTKIVIYNLWEDDEGKLELDFDADEEDIQIRGVNRDEKKIEMSKLYPNSRHFLTYQHSLRSYASILYLRMPPGFRMILRGEEIRHHDLVNDMMLSKEITYRPVAVDGKRKNDSNMVAVGTIGFVKDASSHIDVQGFNVYHKNRLIKPFWRVWNAAGSDGRGVIGVLEANFVEPAHDKQGFERTTALGRLEARLVVLQKNYWSTNCQEIGYAPRRKGKKPNSPEDEKKSPTSRKSNADNSCRNDKSELESKTSKDRNFATPKDTSCNNVETPTHAQVQTQCIPSGRMENHSNVDAMDINTDSTKRSCVKSKEDGDMASGGIEEIDRVMVENLLRGLKAEREKQKLLESRLQDTQQRIKEREMETERLIDMFSEESAQRDAEEDSLRNSLKEAETTILSLFHMVEVLDSQMALSC